MPHKGFTKASQRPHKGLTKASQRLHKGLTKGLTKASQRLPIGLPMASQRPPQGLPQAYQSPLKGLSPWPPKASTRSLRVPSAFGDFWKACCDLFVTTRTLSVACRSGFRSLGGAFSCINAFERLSKDIFQRASFNFKLKTIFSLFFLPKWSQIESIFYEKTTKDLHSSFTEYCRIFFTHSIACFNEFGVLFPGEKHVAQ